MTDKEQRKLCEKCKKESDEVECYAHFKSSGRSILPGNLDQIVPDYCKFSHLMEKI